MASLTETEWPSIPDFYAHKDIFVTGATGLMGKCLVEKLLRSVPDLGRVIILMREKKGKTIEERTRDLLSCALFDTLRDESPNALSKVVPVSGDIMEPELGLRREDKEMLFDHVAVVFHLAATIRFDLPLRQALTMNVVAVKELIKLCRSMKNLKALLHVSTAFSQTNKIGAIEEINYPTTVHPDKILGLLDWMSDDQLATLTPTLLEGRPNTYTYTKALAEQIFMNETQGLPVAIFRPSIIGASWKEPVEGWVDAIQGPSGLFIAVGKGVLRVMRCNVHRVADFVPVDLVNNFLISIGWMTGVNPTPKPLFYHFTSGSVNPMKWMQLYEYLLQAYNENPFDQVLRRPWVCKAWPQYSYPCWNFVMHLIPGFMIDLLLRIFQKKPFLLRSYRKINIALTQMDYFLQHDWRWSHRNADKLFSLMTTEDQNTFDFDIRKMQWPQYIHIFSLGVKRYLLNEDLANLPKARQNIKRLRNIRYTFNFVVFLLATRVLYRRSEVARQLWNGILEFCVRWLAKLGIPAWHSF